MSHNHPPPGGDDSGPDSNSAPFGNRLRVDFPAGDTYPVPFPPPRDIPFPLSGSYGSIDPNINSPRVQS